MLKDAVRRQFDVLMVWSIDRLARSVLHVANALAELDAAGVALYSDQQAIDSTTPMGRAMIQMASVFGRTGKIDHPREGSRRSRSRAPAREEARSPEGVAEDRGRHQEASERRERHPQGCGVGRRRKRHRAASEAGDGRGIGEGSVTGAGRNRAACDQSETSVIFLCDEWPCRHAALLLPTANSRTRGRANALSSRRPSSRGMRLPRPLPMLDR
jgi:Resolvase, N terminal domain